MIRDKSVVEALNDPSRISNMNNNIRTISTFESLPLEILEKIFFYALNVNLPRALPSLAAFLSNERVYRLLILLAFWDNEHNFDPMYNSPEGKDVFGGDPARYGDFGRYTWRENRTLNIPWILRPLGRDYTRLTPGERVGLQADILECKWCTNERIRRQLPDLARLVIARWCISAGYIFENESESREFERLLDYEETEENHEGVVVRLKRKRAGQRDEEEEEDEYPCCKIVIRPGEFVYLMFGCRTNRDGSRATEVFLDRDETMNCWYPVLSLVEIPPLLFDPDTTSEHNGVILKDFSDARLSLLNTLRLSSQLMFHDSGPEHVEVFHCRSTLLDGIRTAICAFNIRALDLLLRLDHYFHRKLRPFYWIPSDLFRIAAKQYIKAANAQRQPFHLKDSPYTEPIETVEDAALLIYHFVFVSSVESIPYDDPVVRQVPMVAGGAYKDWMMDLFEMLPEHIEELKKKENAGEDTVFWLRAFYYGFDAEMDFRYTGEVHPERPYLRIPAESLSDDMSRYGDFFTYPH